MIRPTLPWGVSAVAFFFWTAFMMSPSAFGESKVKYPNVSGQFYPADPRQLSSQIDKFLPQATVEPSSHHIDIVIAPHAGYIYSGAVAAYGFKAASRNRYKTIIILAPSHYAGFDGISVWDEGAFQTPLGSVEVDHDFAKKLTAVHKKFYFLAEAFDQEHSLEVEIPFLQKTFKDFKIVPVVMGQPGPKTLEEFAVALRHLIGGRKDVLLVVSTDMSHYHEDSVAREMDHRTLEAVQGLKVEQFWKECASRTMEMCGFVPVTAALLYARLADLNHVDVLRYANSGDVGGDRERVVGYGSVVIYGEPTVDGIDLTLNQNALLETVVEPEAARGKRLTKAQKQRLLDIAQKTIEGYVNDGKTLDFQEDDPRLREEEGAFVTIHKHGRLRGCIGNVLGRGPLYLTVRDMAIASATQDPRFPPLGKEELKDIDLEISVLSKPWVVKGVEEIQLGVHGVIVSRGPLRHGLFLPQVADETGWSKEDFLSQLCAQKAGLPPDAWKDPATRIEVFTADVFSERDALK